MSLTKVTYSMINGEIANVLDFGAIGDGSTLNDVAFAAALASGAKFIRVPAGTYVFGSPIVKPDGVCLQGDGVDVTILSAKHNGNIIEIGTGTPGASLTGENYRTLSNLTLTNFSGFNSAIGIRVVNITGCWFEKVTVIDGPIIGIRLQAVLNSTFIETMTRNCSDVGLYMQSTTLSNGNYRNVFNNCHSYYDEKGIVLDMTNSFENAFIDCAVEGSLNVPIEISNCGKLIFQRLYLEGNGTSMVGGKASIYLRGGDNIVFQDCLEISNIPLFQAAPAATNVFVQNFYNANNNNAITQWSGLMNLQQGRIQFPSTPNISTNPNTLDDYEEGAWVPADVSGAGLVLSNGVCQYTKIGRVVMANFNSTYPVNTDGTTVAFGGLPFNNKGTASINIGFTSSATVARTGITEDESTYSRLYSTSNVALLNSNLSGVNISGTVVYITDA